MTLYIGSIEITPSVTVNNGGGSGGNAITATNYSSSTISQNDKVWINPYYYQSGSSVYLGSTGSGRYVLNNGEFIICSSDNNTMKNAQNITIGKATYASPSQNEHYKQVECPDGIVYSSNSSGVQRVDGGLGWSKSGYCFIYGTSEYLCTTTSTNFKIVKINPNTGEILKTYSGTAPSTQQWKLAYNGENFISLDFNTSDRGLYRITLDDSNGSYSSTKITSLRPGSYILGITSDYKYLIGEERIIDLTNFSDVTQSINFQANLSQYAYFDGKNNIYQIHTGVLSSATGGNYKIEKYDTETKTWSLVSLDYATIMGSTNKVFFRACFENGEITRVFYAEDTGTNPFYTRWKSVQNIGGYNLVKYGLEVTEQTLTGIAQENISVGSSGSVLTILPN